MQELQEYRNQIDSIDSELIKLLGERFQIVEKVGELKKQKNIPALQQDRWIKLLENLKRQGREYNIPPGCIEAVWNTIHETALEKENTILQN